MMRLFIFAVGVVLFGNGTVSANGTAPCPGDCVEVTVCEPTWVKEKRIVKETHYRQVEKEREVTVYRPVKVTKTLEHKCTKFVRVKKVEEQKLDIAKPVSKEVVLEYTVMVPHQELRKGTHKVCRRKLGCCDEYEIVEEPYECMVTVCKPEIRTCHTKVWETVHETVIKQHPVCTVEPVVTVTPYEVTECKYEPVKKMEKYMACEPYTVEKEIEVCVCKMVPKTIKVPKCCN